MTPVVMDLTLRILGDKSPKATHKYAVQKRVKADAAKQNKNNAASAEQVPNGSHLSSLRRRRAMGLYTEACRADLERRIYAASSGILSG